MKRQDIIKRVEKKMPAHTDRYIRAQIQTLYEAQPKKRGSWYYLIAMPALAASFFIALNLYPVQAPGTNQAQVVLASASEVFQKRQILKNVHIHHQKYIIAEGVDKAEYIAATTDLSLEEAQAVPLREDTVEYWHHSHTRKANIDSNLESVNQGLYLVLENEDHIHIFHDPESLKKDRRNPELRVLFDSVHDLSSHYQHYITFTNIDPLVFAQDMEPIESNKNWFRYREHLEGKYIDWIISPEGQILAHEIYVLHEDEAYQMAVITYLGETFIEPQKFGEVFDPNQNEFTQTDVFPLL